jgi:CDP-diglyceride synthetase
VTFSHLDPILRSRFTRQRCCDFGFENKPSGNPGSDICQRRRTLTVTLTICIILADVGPQFLGTLFGKNTDPPV